MIQLPVPKRIDIRKVIDKIHPNKDVDGLTNINKEKLINGIDCLVPCTALGIIDLLKEYEIELKNKNIVVVGRSELVGKPVSILLEKEGGNITICHSKTENLSTYTKNADILISAVGKSKLITKEMVKEDDDIYVFDYMNTVHVKENDRQLVMTPEQYSELRVKYEDGLSNPIIEWLDAVMHRVFGVGVIIVAVFLIAAIVIFVVFIKMRKR